MAGVFGKDPNMNKAGGQKELDRIMGERARKARRYDSCKNLPHRRFD